MQRSFPRAAFILALTLLLLPGVLSAQSPASGQHTQETDLSALKGQNVDSMLLSATRSLPPEKRQQITEALAAMKQENPEIKTVQLKNKTVKFIPMAHAGQSLFYDHVKAAILAHKKEGYTVFYEQIKGSKPAASGAAPATDSLRLKFRKMIGTEPTRKTYSMLRTFFPGITVQPAYDSLGVTATDVNADVSTAQMVQLYEQLYGPITLDACDFKTPAGSGLYPCTPLKHNIDPVIKDFRNRELAKMIKAAPQRKILVIYGAAHINPVMDMIRR